MSIIMDVITKCKDNPEIAPHARGISAVGNGNTGMTIFAANYTVLVSELRNAIGALK